MGSKFQLSPGVNVSEVDLTGYIPSVATTGGAVVGAYEWGPVLDYTIVSDSKKLEEIFGKPTEDTYVDWFTAYNFLAYSNNCNVIRVVGSGALNSSDDGAGVLIKNETHYTSVFESNTTVKFAAKYAGEKGDSIEVHIADSATFTGWTYENLFDGAPGTSTFTSGVGGSNDEIHVVVVDAGGKFTGVPNTVLEKFSYLSKANDGKSEDGGPNFYGSVLNKESSYVWWLDTPAETDYASNGAITAIAVDLAGSGYETAPTVTITGDGADATATAVLSSTGSAVDITVDAAGTGYATGDSVSITGNGGTVTGTVTDDGAGGIQSISIDDAGSGFTGDLTGATVTAVTGTGNDDATADVTIGYSVSSITVDTDGANYVSGTTTVTIDDTTYGSGATATATVEADTGVEWNNVSLNNTFKSLSSDITYSLTGGDNGGTLVAGDITAGWDMFKNAEVVDVSLLILGNAGGDTLLETVIEHVISNVAETRKDCVAFFSPKRSDVVNVEESQAAENAITTKNNIALSTSYAFMDSGWKYQYDAYNDKYRWLPLNADVAGATARSDYMADPWWSPAGYTRGQIKNVIKLAINPSKTYRDELYKNNINPIVSFKGEGVVLYGDRTLLAKPSAFQKLNVRRLFIVLEKAIAKASKYLLFEFNDAFTRAQFVNMTEPYLREVKGRRGIYDFRVICDESNNTGEVIDRSEFVGDIYIKPAQSINFIQLNFVAVRTGVEFEEVVGRF